MPPPQKPPPPKFLTLTLNSVYNTALSVPGDKIHYEVRSFWWERSMTRFNKLDVDNRELRTYVELEKTGKKESDARLRWNKDSGKIVMKRTWSGNAAVPEDEKNGEWMSADEWLRYDPATHEGRFFGDDGEEYIWKEEKRRLQLVKASDEEQKPLVKFHRHQRYAGVFRMRKHAMLEISADVKGSLLDKVIVSYFIVERKRRAASLLVRIEQK